MKTMEGNKLIAEFMGSSIDQRGKEREPFYISEDININVNVHKMQFNTSWDWLMPVVSKCDGLSFYKRGESDIKWGEIFNDEEVIRAFQANEIDVVYNSVIEFIKWYNEFQSEL